MGKVKLILLSAAILLGPVVIYIIILVASSFRNGHTLAEMDWNGDGVTTPLEILEGSNILKRVLTDDGKNCTEFIHMKDGFRVRLDCH